MARADVDGLLSVLRTGGDIAVERGKGVKITVKRYRGRELGFPTIISTSEDHFAAYMDVLGDQARHLSPDQETRQAGFGLLLVHLDEEFFCLAGNPDLIQIGPKELYVRRTRPRPPDFTDDLPPGDYEWRA